MSGSIVGWGANRRSDLDGRLAWGHVRYRVFLCISSYVPRRSASIPLPHLETYANRISGSYLSMDKADAIGTYANANPTCTRLHHPGRAVSLVSMG